ncbi:MAG: hypothetical protein QOE11_2684 [Solirubrobacteraceae bacterium]|jgi:hypothetical protein|nr:hypothetical protein [Solirubrobacteraceae bacterium]
MSLSLSPTRPRALLAGLACALGAGVLATPPSALAGGGGRLFITSAVEHPADHTATFPIYHGTSGGHGVSYIVLDASTSAAAERYGVNRANKLRNARGTTAVQKVTVRDGVIDFPASIDFRPVRRVVPGPGGFPPAAAEPGAVGDAGYTPLIELPDGTILNAPQIANDTGRADKITNLDSAARTATLLLTDGFARGQAVRYVSTDASDPGVATLENSTYAPALNAAPFAGGDGTDSARATLVAFVNGQTGAANPQRQGLNSALLDGLDPLNVLAWKPNQGRYSPLWDVHPAAWSAAAAAAGADVRQTSVDDVFDLAAAGAITGPGGAPFGPGGFIVDCPIVSSEG